MKYPWIDGYLLEKKGVEKDLQPVWNWIRYKIGGKLFCAVCLDKNDQPYYITLKLAPEHGDALRRLWPDIQPGYYADKTHWNSIKADGEVPEELMKDMLDEAYDLVFASLTKKKKKEILSQ